MLASNSCTLQTEASVTGIDINPEIVKKINIAVTDKELEVQNELVVKAREKVI